MVALAQKGDAPYRNDFDLVLRRESVNPKDLCQANHTELDVMVLNESDRPVRPWLSLLHIWGVEAAECCFQVRDSAVR